MHIGKIAIMSGASILLGGCVVSAAKNVVTAPVKVISKTADMMTTSQSEADEKRGRAMRQRDENLGRLYTKRSAARRKCYDGDQSACDDVDSLEVQIDAEHDRPL